MTEGLSAGITKTSTKPINAAPPLGGSLNVVGDYEVLNAGVGTWRTIGQRCLFLTAIASLEWSRGYSWYVELDDVPYPFQRGGVIGLPVTSITYEVANAEEFTWDGGLETFGVPKGKGLCTLNMTFLDDGLGTMFTFFERWFNHIYNSRAGVLPLAEAAKCISIYKLSLTRFPITRFAWRYDVRGDSLGQTTLSQVDSREFLIYPKGVLQEQEKLDSNPREYTIQFTIVNQENPDYGDPGVHEGLSRNKTGLDLQGTGFLAKASRYF